MSITLIPLLSRRFEENEEDAWRFFGTVFCYLIILHPAFQWLTDQTSGLGTVAPNAAWDCTCRQARCFRPMTPMRPFRDSTDL